MDQAFTIGGTLCEGCKTVKFTATITVRRAVPIPEKTMIPARHKIRDLIEEVAIREHSCTSGRFLSNTKHMNAERRPSSCLVPIYFSIVGANRHADVRRHRREPEAQRRRTVANRGLNVRVGSSLCENVRSDRIAP